ncbi:MAG: sensor histidine kinase [Pseudomonadota bacterium]
MPAEAQFFWALYLAALLPVLALHLLRARLTLAPVLAAAGLLTFLIWKIAETGWWVEHGPLKFNAALLGLVPAVLAGIALVYTMDGLRAAKAYYLIVVIAAAFAIGFLEFRSGLAAIAPLPEILKMSLVAQLALAAAVAVALAAVVLAAELCRRLSVALAPAVGFAGGIVAFAAAFSYFTYGPKIGTVNLSNEAAEYLLVAIPGAILLAAYGIGARKFELFMPSRSIGSLFALWHSAEWEAGKARENILGARHVIDELQSLNRALGEEHQRRKHQIENSPLAIMDVDEAGKITDLNAAARALLAPVAGASIEGAFRGFDAAFGRRGAHSQIFTLQGAEGERKIDVTVMPVLHGWRAGGFSVIAEDVTARERARVRHAVSARVRDIHRTGRVISHDFSNLLTAIESHLALIRRTVGGKAQPEVAEALGAIADASARGREMLGQFGSGQAFYRPELKPHDTAGLVNEALRIQGPAARDAGIELASAVDPRVTVEADGNQLVRVLINLIGNAIRATARGGRISLDARRDGSGVAIRVSDDGRGMSPEQVAAAFDPGFSTKGGGQGGLGLAICYLIVDAHGGRLALESAPGRGTTATIWLPMGAAVAGAALGLAQEPEGVLVYVAGERLRGLLADRLSEIGCEVAEIATLEEFAAVVADEPDRWRIVVCEAGTKLPDEIGGLERVAIGPDGVAPIAAGPAPPWALKPKIAEAIEAAWRADRAQTGRAAPGWAAAAVGRRS